MQFYVLEVEIGSSHDTTFHKMEPIHRGDIADCRRCLECYKPVGILPVNAFALAANIDAPKQQGR